MQGGEGVIVFVCVCVCLCVFVCVCVSLQGTERMWQRLRELAPALTPRPAASPPPATPQRECGVRDLLRVAPLFETLDDLHNAPETMDTLFKSEWYLNHINGTQVGANGSG